MSDPVASVVLATRNRRECLLRAVGSCFAQEGVPLEVLVFDDGSSDGSADAVAAAFPPARVVRAVERGGYVALRNRGFREARGEFVFSLDDDAYFTGRDTVARTVGCFRRRPGAGAVAIPYVEPRLGRARARPMPPVPPLGELASYTGCAHALRRDAALGAGGYREAFVHEGEERDLALRLRARGHAVVYGEGDPVVHARSPARDVGRMVGHGVRNLVLFDGLNLPAAALPARLAWDIARVASYDGWRGAGPRLRHAAAGLREAWRLRGERAAVPWAAYRAFRRLPGHGPCELLDGPLPPPCAP